MLSQSPQNKNKNHPRKKIVIRPAELADTRELAAILAYSFYDFPDFLGCVYPFLQFTIYEDLRHRLRSCSPFYCCLVAIIFDPIGQSQIAGTAEVAIRSASFWSSRIRYPYIANLAVKNNYRRLGIGGKLLTTCEQIAADWGYQETRLHVLASNNPAKQLYVGNGYQICQVETDWSNLFSNSSPRLLLSKQQSC